MTPVLSRRRRSVAFAAAFGALVSVVVLLPGRAAAAEPCLYQQPNAVRASISPFTFAARDLAFNPDDPDAADAPIEPIVYPDEAGLWAAAGVPAGDAIVAAVQRGEARRAELGLSGPARPDPEVSDSIVRLYCALFDRQPDSLDLQYWAGRYANGLPLVSIAEAFTTSAEFVARFGAPTDEGLVHIMFDEVLRRAPAPGTVRSYLEALEQGVMSRGELITSFTESSEFVSMTGTTPPVKPELPYPNVGSGRRIIYDNTHNRVYLIEASGELAKTHLVSGRRGIPDPGRYRVYSMSRYAWAPYDGITMEFMVRFARAEWPYGFHSIPVWPDEQPLQDSEQLGTHRSGGCVRQEFDDAAFVFDWSKIGDRVIVIRP